MSDNIPGTRHRCAKRCTFIRLPIVAGRQTIIGSASSIINVILTGICWLAKGLDTGACIKAIQTCGISGYIKYPYSGIFVQHLCVKVGGLFLCQELTTVGVVICSRHGYRRVRNNCIIGNGEICNAVRKHNPETRILRSLKTTLWVEGY